jgi:hypothetical protein
MPEDEVRSHRIVTFMTEGEYGVLQEIADNNDSSLSTMVHGVLVEYLDKQKR